MVFFAHLCFLLYDVECLEPLDNLLIIRVFVELKVVYDSASDFLVTQKLGCRKFLLEGESVAWKSFKLTVPEYPLVMVFLHSMVFHYE